jgi:S-adenosylmethionine hydrolase
MPIITFTSDIGNQDFMPGAVKGKLLTAMPDANIVDITHLLSPFNYTQAAYICRNAINNFPVGSYHLVMIDLFDEKPDHLLMIEHNGHFIGCADNGLITLILEEIPQKVVALPTHINEQKNTLHCATIFAEAFKAIELGTPLEELGDPQVSIKVKNPLKAVHSNEWMEGQIIFIDNFENVVVNIHRDDFEAERKGRRFSIVFKRNETIEKISESYADVAEGEKLAYFNSSGYLEIAINKGNAAGLFGLQGFSEALQVTAQQNKLFYQTVKIFFENN